MIELAPAAEHVSGLSLILHEVADSGDMALDADKTLGFIKTQHRSGAVPGQPEYFAVLAEGTVVGYLAGRSSGGLRARPDLTAGRVTAWVGEIALDRGQRGKGFGREAVRQFAQRARTEAAAEMLALRVDRTGGEAAVERRRQAFRKWGFKIDRKDPSPDQAAIASIAVLLE